MDNEGKHHEGNDRTAIVKQYPDANHGAGTCTPTFTPFLWPSFVGKYSSTMVS